MDWCPVQGVFPLTPRYVLGIGSRFSPNLAESEKENEKLVRA